MITTPWNNNNKGNNVHLAQQKSTFSTSTNKWLWSLKWSWICFVIDNCLFIGRGMEVKSWQIVAKKKWYRLKNNLASSPICDLKTLSPDWISSCPDIFLRLCNWMSSCNKWSKDLVNKHWKLIKMPYIKNLCS